ncbi:MAG: GNAT family N-acetyltransferase [Oscillospiraceae bacterium]|nr:GNAT family N-acetyltransferase [Oscillospiraceae bacterium]
MIRKAVTADIESVDEIYSKVHTEEEQGRVTVGWARGVYPTKQTAADAVSRGDLFVDDIEGKIVATGIINQIQVPEYADCRWQYDVPASEVMVLHTLIVTPEERGRGCARKFMEFYESYALSQGCRYLRMDTQVKNKSARAMYAKLGFKEQGTVSCVFNGIAGVQLVCLEKKI